MVEVRVAGLVVEKASYWVAMAVERAVVAREKVVEVKEAAAAVVKEAGEMEKRSGSRTPFAPSPRHRTRQCKTCR